MSRREIAGGRVPIRTWARSLDEGTIRQLRKLADLPFVVEHVAAMADAHVSAGVAVGSVFATEHEVVPGALGGDLGCGMSATRLGAGRLERRVLERLVEQLVKAVPAGTAIHRSPVPVPEHLQRAPLSTRSLEHTRDLLTARHLGTLGGGNHFIELDRDGQGHLWLLVHSGSRGLGAAIAAHHAKAAGAEGSLSALDVRAEGAAYLADLGWALEFARANRQCLASKAREVFADVTGMDPQRDDSFDVHHNFVARETWFGRELYVHRKGAVAAPLDAPVLIPGSMGTASYVAVGLGSEAAFGSCSHGAGRVLSRGAARSKITLPALRQAMHRVAYPAHLGRSLVEEAPAAYRDVDEVLADQSDLVQRRIRLEPLAVLKG